MLTLENHIDRGVLQRRNLTMEGVKAIGCGLSIDETSRSTFEDCRFSKITAKKCVMGFPIFQRCTFRDVKCDFLACYGTLFLECRLEGLVSGVNFALTTRSVPISDVLNRERMEAGLSSIPDARKIITEQNLTEADNAEYCLDVRNAILTDVRFNDEAIVPKVLFNKGQCLIYRGNNLQEKLTRAFRTVTDRSLQAALSPPVGRSDSLYLATLERDGASERIEDIKRLVSSLGIEVIEEPLLARPSR